MRYRIIQFAFLLTGLVVLTTSQGWSGETAHYYPGIAGVRDFIMPPAGFYYLQYNAYYHSDSFRDKDGKKVDSIEVAGKKVDIDTTVDMWTIVPTFVWSTDCTILGARYAGFGQFSFGQGNLQAEAEVLDQSIGNNTSSFGLGDLYVQPLWLGWHWTHFDLSAATGVWAPIGKYSAGANDNVGLGYWSFDFVFNGTYYPFKNQATALSATVMYEINTKREGVDIRPGDHVTLELGISQYLSERLELGLSAYGQWQVTNDGGADAVNVVHDQLYGAGGQIAYWFVKNKFYGSLRYIKQFEARDRFEGQYGVLTLLYRF